MRSTGGVPIVRRGADPELAVVVIYERRAEAEADRGGNVGDDVARLQVADADVRVVRVLWEPLLGVAPVVAVIGPASPRAIG